MNLSTKGQYGTRALLELALRWGQGPVPLKDIAEWQQISVSYLQHLITPLVAAGIIRSTRGPRGGAALARPPQDIRLSEVIGILEGSTAPVECVDDPLMCPRANLCVTRDVWTEMKRAVNGVLESTTLQDLVERSKQKGEHGAEMYQI